MKKSFLLLIIIYLTTNILYSNPVNLRIKPVVSVLYPTAPALRQYYERKVILLYGGEIDLISPFYQFGLYVSVQIYQFSIHDKNLFNSPIREEGQIIHIGALKEFHFREYNFSVKAGISNHDDELAMADEKGSRTGFQLGMEIHRAITKRIGLSGSIVFDYQKLSIPEYVTFAYSRHCNYLSGKDFNSGGFILQTAIIFKLF